jgi:hypothetical protein
MDELEQSTNDVLNQKKSHLDEKLTLERENKALRADVEKLLRLLNDFSSLSVVKVMEDSKKALAEKEATEAVLAQLKDDTTSEKKYHLTIIETLRNVACGMALQYGLDVK